MKQSKNDSCMHIEFPLFIKYTVYVLKHKTGVQQHVSMPYTLSIEHGVCMFVGMSLPMRACVCDTFGKINMTRSQLNASCMYETPASVNMS